MRNLFVCVCECECVHPSFIALRTARFISLFRVLFSPLTLRVMFNDFFFISFAVCLFSNPFYPSNAVPFVFTSTLCTSKIQFGEWTSLFSEGTLLSFCPHSCARSIHHKRWAQYLFVNHRNCPKQLKATHIRHASNTENLFTRARAKITNDTQKKEHTDRARKKKVEAIRKKKRL